MPQLSRLNDKPLSAREKVIAHQTEAQCASCHRKIDPIGFGMENFDPIGRFRTEDRDGNVIDPSGTLPDGSSFEGVAELSSILHEDERYTTCVTNKVMTFALGRSLTPRDRCFVEEIAAAAADTGTSLREVIVQVALNEVFRSAGGRESEVSR